VVEPDGILRLSALNEQLFTIRAAGRWWAEPCKQALARRRGRGVWIQSRGEPAGSGCADV